MRGSCCAQDEMGHHGGAPLWGAVFGIWMLLYSGVATWLLLRMTSALETMALAKSLDEMEDRLSDVERADIEGRIRENLYPS